MRTNATGRMVNCHNCGIDVYKTPSKIKKSKHLFCSSQCHDAFRMKRIEVPCAACGKTLHRVPSRMSHVKHAAVCSRKCRNEAARGKNYPQVFRKGDTGAKCINFKGGKQEANGYVMVLVPEHPLANKRGYVYEHRLIMEKHLNRYLTREEVVHHKNLNKKDNTIENLQLFENDSAHHAHHSSLGTPRKPLPETALRNIREAASRRVLTDEARAKIAAANSIRFKGVPKSPEHVAKIVASNKATRQRLNAEKLLNKDLG